MSSSEWKDKIKSPLMDEYRDYVSKNPFDYESWVKNGIIKPLYEFETLKPRAIYFAIQRGDNRLSFIGEYIESGWGDSSPITRNANHRWRTMKQTGEVGRNERMWEYDRLRKESPNWGWADGLDLYIFLGENNFEFINWQDNPLEVKE